MSLTPEGEVYLEHARRIMASIDDLSQQLGVAKERPQGLLRVNADPRLRPQPRRAADLGVREAASVGGGAAAALGQSAGADRGPVRRLRPLRRAARRARDRGQPGAEPAPPVRFARLPGAARHAQVPSELARHDCIGIRQGEEAYGVWRLSSGRGRHAVTEAVKVRGSLTTNDGGIAVAWALDGTAS
jgi:DNA-binding transcriptional LysR family regulator